MVHGSSHWIPSLTPAGTASLSAGMVTHHQGAAAHGGLLAPHSLLARSAPLCVNPENELNHPPNPTSENLPRVAHSGVSSRYLQETTSTPVILTDGVCHLKKRHSSHPLLIRSFTFHGQPRGRRCVMENSRNKQFLRFKLGTTPRGMMKSHADRLHPARGMNDPFVQCLHALVT